MRPKAWYRPPHSPAWPSSSKWGPVSRLGPQNLLPLPCYLPGRQTPGEGRAAAGVAHGGHPAAGHRQLAGGEGGGNTVSHASHLGVPRSGVPCSSLDVCYGAGNAQNLTFTL